MEKKRIFSSLSLSPKPFCVLVANYFKWLCIKLCQKDTVLEFEAQNILF